MKTFKYWDCSKGQYNKILLMEVQATNILEADKQINEALGIKVEKNSAICCEIA